jgi:hypothetical protein
VRWQVASIFADENQLPGFYCVFEQSGKFDFLRHGLIDASHAEYANLKRGLKIPLADTFAVSPAG